MMRTTSRGLTRFALLSATLCVVLAAGVKAQNRESNRPQPEPTKLPVSEHRLVEYVLERNLDLLAARQRLAEAQGLLQQAGLRPNPELDISLASGDPLNSPGEREFSFGYSHTFELGGKRARRLEVAQMGYELARSEFADRKRRLVSDVRVRYAEALAALQNLENIEELLQLTRQSLDLARARAETGEGPRLEQQLLEVEVNRLTAQRMIFAAHVEQSLLGAKLLAGLPLEGELRLSGSLEITPEPPELQVAIEQAFSRRPDLAAARLEERLAEAELELAKAGGTPDLIARGGYSHLEANFHQYGFSEPGGSLAPIRDRDNAITGGISIRLPIADRNQGNIEAAIARRRGAQLKHQSMERLVRQEVLNSLNRLMSTRRALQFFKTGVVGQSQENVRVVRGAYQLGELRLLDVINEQRRLTETHQAYTELLRDAFVASVELGRVIAAPVGQLSKGNRE